MHARHVLVPLSVLAGAAAVVLWRGFGGAPIVDVSGDVSTCAANLRHIYTDMLLYSARHNTELRLPQESGVRLLAALVGAEDAAADHAYLTCPGPGAEAVPKDVDYRSLETLTGAASAYAARDTVTFPLAKFPSGGSELEPLVACDNAHGLNHDGCMNVLYSDGSVVTLFLAEEIERGHLPAGATTIPVGKDSPIPDLRKLTPD